MSKTKVSVDVRVDPIDKTSWKAEAAAADVSVSELVRQRMSAALATADSMSAVPTPTKAPVNLDAAELQSLRGWLALADSDGEVDDALLAEWKAYAAARGITFAELLQRVALYVNVQHL